MTRLAQRLTVALVLLFTCALPVGGAQASVSRENVATAIAQDQDGSRAFDFEWDVSKQSGGVVDHLNAAHATAQNCTGCRATAIAFQIVIVSGGATTYRPHNEAIAQNIACQSCEAFARAAQFVRVVEAPVKFTDAGRAELADVRADLSALERQDLPPFQLAEAVELQKSRVSSVLNHELVLKSDPRTEADVNARRLYQAADTG